MINKVILSYLILSYLTLFVRFPNRRLGTEVKKREKQESRNRKQTLYTWCKT